MICQSYLCSVPVSGTLDTIPGSQLLGWCYEWTVVVLPKTALSNDEEETLLGGTQRNIERILGDDHVSA
jgi:hypothetical protein